jgi:hypothetical protein
MKSISAIVLAIALMSVVGSAQAGPYGDDLSKCLVSSTSAADKSLLMRWIFAAMSLNKDVSQFVDIPQGTRDQIDKDAGGLFTRLLADSCKQQAHDAYKYEGGSAITNAFQLLGQIASHGIFEDPAVTAGVGNLTKNVDQARINEALEIKAK